MTTEKPCKPLDSHAIEGAEPSNPVHINICQNNTYRKDLSWLHFDIESRIKQRQQVKDHQSYIPVLETYGSTSPDMKTIFQAKPYDRFIEIKSNFRRKKLHKTNQGSSFLIGSSFINRESVRAPTNIGQQDNASIFKDEFSSVPFHIDSSKVFSLVKWNKLSFSSIQIAKLLHFPVHGVTQVRVKYRSITGH